MKSNMWLQEAPEVVNKLESNQAEYIPIGQIEKTLDEYSEGNWGTTNYRFQIIRNGSYWFADASVELFVSGRYSMVGAVTFPISSRDDNMDYSGTALSFCIANAAKKMGIRFGRGLNGRLDKGETGMPIIQTKAEFDPADPNTIAFEEVKRQLSQFVYYEDAKAFLDTTDFKNTIEAKLIVNTKTRRS